MYCQQCGSQLPDTAKFCGECGAPTGATAQSLGDVVSPSNTGVNSTASSSDMYRLTVIREKQFFAVNPSIYITVDNNMPRIPIDNADQVSIPISAGVHNLYFSCGPRSKSVDINVASDLVIVVRWNRITGGIEVR